MQLCTRLPAAPIQRALLRTRISLGLCWEEMAVRLGMSSRTLMRVMSSRTVSPYVGDHVAIRLGTHPALLWPKEWGRATTPKQQGGDGCERRAGTVWLVSVCPTERSCGSMNDLATSQPERQEGL